MSDDIENDRAVAAAITALSGSRPGDPAGLLLLGPSSRTARAIRLIQDRMGPGRLLPVPCRPEAATVDELRAEAERAHRRRTTPGTELLIAVAEAGQLSPSMLRELDMAAEAAETHGGLRLLLAAEADPRPALRRNGFDALDRALAREVVVSPPAPPAPPPAAPTRPDRLSPDRRRDRDEERQRPDASPRTGLLVLAALAALALAALVILAVFLNHAATPTRTVPAEAPPAVPQPAVPPQGPVQPTAPPETAAPATVTPVVPPPASAPPASSLSPAVPPAQPGPVAPAPPSASAPTSVPVPVPEPVPAPGEQTAPPPAPASTPAPSPDRGPAQLPAAVTPTPTASSPAPAPAAASSPAPTTAATPPPPAPAVPPAPAGSAPANASSLLLLASPGDTLRGLYDQVYRSVAQPPSFAAVSALNPRIQPGTRLVFPAPSGGWGSPAARP
ncbi:MAG: hypothetical protein INR65_14425 [Gluconacetobacter diazotrophicus]|nr:hypothetical protein [Gluconacetobacter diazotrophicus]